MTTPDYEGLRKIQDRAHRSNLRIVRHTAEAKLIDRAIRRLAGQPPEILIQAHKLARAAYASMHKDVTADADPYGRTAELEELEELASDCIAGRLGRPEREIVRGPGGLASHVRTKDGLAPIIRDQSGRATGLGRAISTGGASAARR